MSMQMGGAIGNLIDRLTVGRVTDFISIGNFPVFNVADSSISVGCVVLLLGVWWQERLAKKAKEAQATPPDQPSEVEDPAWRGSQ
jgi:signal peptidase II